MKDPLYVEKCTACHYNEPDWEGNDLVLCPVCNETHKEIMKGRDEDFVIWLLQEFGEEYRDEDQVDKLQEDFIQISEDQTIERGRRSREFQSMAGF